MFGINIIMQGVSIGIWLVMETDNTYIHIGYTCLIAVLRIGKALLLRPLDKETTLVFRPP